MHECMRYVCVGMRQDAQRPSCQWAGWQTGPTLEMKRGRSVFVVCVWVFGYFGTSANVSSVQETASL
jgi:hypothetical protein